MSNWNLSMLALHLLVLVGSISLVPKAPCWMQQLVQVGVALSALAFAVGYYAVYQGAWWAEHSINAGYSIEHLSVLVLVFRLAIFPNGIPAWNSSSPPYRSS